MSKPNITDVYERLASLESNYVNQAKKLDTIHKALIGNGQPGIIAEYNQMKGAVRFFGYVISVIVGFLGVAVGVLAYIK